MFNQKNESERHLGVIWSHNRVWRQYLKQQRIWKTVSETLDFVDLGNATASFHKPIYFELLIW